MNEKLILQNFERQLKDLIPSCRDFKIKFLLQKEGDVYNVTQYDCWNIITHLGCPMSEIGSKVDEIAERAFKDIKKLYPAKNIIAVI